MYINAMSIIVHLIKEYLSEEKFTTAAILTTSFMTNIIQAVGFTKVTANILSQLQNKNYANAYTWFWYFIYLSLIYLGISFIYRIFQNNVLSKLYQWTRLQIIRMVLTSNNEEYTNDNFSAMVSPINRIASTTFTVLNDTITFYIPNFAFLLVTIGYIMYQHITIGIAFVIGNLLWMLYLYYNWNPLVKKSKEYELEVNNAENYLVEMLNNVDKIISRGQAPNELDILESKTDKTSQTAYAFYNFLDNNILVVNMIVLATTLVCIGLGIQLHSRGHFNNVGFATFFTLLLMYRERVLSSISLIPEFIDTMSRSETLLKQFGDVKQNYDTAKSKTYIEHDLTFDDLVLENVSFEYNGKPIFQDTNLHLQTTQNKIIGITGPSGKGKSTMCKMFLKMYKCSHGSVLIDGIDVETIDPLYIRANITYVNQNAKLFDRKILENILFGCKDEDICREKFKVIFSYPKIQELFKGVSLDDSKCGPLGEKLSGGQRQVVNIISGLVNPSRILILDEPTNALDKSLKNELLEIIKRFKAEKQAIIIITHDKDVYPLFDQQIEI